MAAANWGTKRRCATCGAAFYDLNRDPIVCPKCQSAYVAAPKLPMRGSRSRTVEHVVPEPEAAAFEEDEILEHADEDEDEADIPHDTDHDGEDEELRE